MDHDKIFLNYWNIKQVFFLEGHIDLTLNLGDFISTLIN